MQRITRLGHSNHARNRDTAEKRTSIGSSDFRQVYIMPGTSALELIVPATRPKGRPQRKKPMEISTAIAVISGDFMKPSSGLASGEPGTNSSRKNTARKVSRARPAALSALDSVGESSRSSSLASSGELPAVVLAKESSGSPMCAA
ncbi:hypothetical protein CHAD_08810 [Corynebacterium hadale]|nr:hypothetical protein CHAD_08810 [Corynebacterium hadale]